MFSMCSELTPRARIPDTRIPQLMQPCTVMIQLFRKLGVDWRNKYLQGYYWRRIGRRPRGCNCKQTNHMGPEARLIEKKSKNVLMEKIQIFQILKTLPFHMSLDERSQNFKPIGPLQDISKSPLVLILRRMSPDSGVLNQIKISEFPQ